MTGKATHDQQQRIINRQEKTEGADVPVPGETLKHASKRYPKPGPGDAYNISTGDRSIKHGAGHPGAHDKHRVHDD